MKPIAFEYFSPGSVAESIELLERYGEEAKLIAGGQSLVPMMNFRLARPSVLIDINGIKELGYIREEGDELVIGALTREYDLEESPLVKDKCPILAKAISFIGHSTIRNRGTIGGSLVHADPSAELPTVITTLDAEMKIVGPSGERTLGSKDFFLTYLTSFLEPSEILTEIRIPVLPAKTGWSFMETSRRSGDFFLAAVSTILFMEDSGICKEARISLGGVGSTPIRAEEAEALLAGQELTEALIEEAGRLAIEATDAESDYHASAEYRRNLTGVFVRRTLREALTVAKGGE
jgi:CO/xanthine dehydrogenase FAD-binding subunit